MIEESSLDLADDATNKLFTEAPPPSPVTPMAKTSISPTSPLKSGGFLSPREDTLFEKNEYNESVVKITTLQTDFLTSDNQESNNNVTTSALPPLPPGHIHTGGDKTGAIMTAAVAAAMTAGSLISSARSSFAISRSEQKRREALWDLFQSECAFLYDHLMVLKNVFMEPLKKIQVEGFAMFAEPEMLFGNLDELCCVTYAFCKEFLSVILNQMNSYEVNATEALVKLFQKVCSQAICHVHVDGV